MILTNVDGWWLAIKYILCKKWFWFNLDEERRQTEKRGRNILTNRDGDFHQLLKSKSKTQFLIEKKFTQNSPNWKIKCQTMRRPTQKKTSYKRARKNKFFKKTFLKIGTVTKYFHFTLPHRLCRLKTVQALESIHNRRSQHLSMVCLSRQYWMLRFGAQHSCLSEFFRTRRVYRPTTVFVSLWWRTAIHLCLCQRLPI